MDNSFENIMAKIIESFGDFSVLTKEEINTYTSFLCDKYGLDKSTQPIRFIKDKNSENIIPYLTRNATDQLRKNLGISVIEENIQFSPNGLACIVTVKVQDKEGRTDMDTGSVFIGGLVGNEYSDKIMTCVTKAKKRATISLSGIGILDETEVQGIAEGVLRESVQSKKSLEGEMSEEEISEEEISKITLLVDNAAKTESWITTEEYLRNKFKKSLHVLDFALKCLNEAKDKNNSLSSAGVNDLNPFEFNHNESSMNIENGTFEIDPVVIEDSIEYELPVSVK
jgi:hypothetical protein